MPHTRGPILVLFTTVAFAACTVAFGQPGTSRAHGRVADHAVVHELRTGAIPEAEIRLAKETLHIAYGHTSHGSQVTDGMRGLVDFANDGGLRSAYSHDLFAWNHAGSNGALHLYEGDGYGTGPLDHDAGYFSSDWNTNGHHSNWYRETIEFLDDPANSEFNVVMWSWCGQVSGRSEQAMIDTYLEPMSDLEERYPDVIFVYMTGHLDGTGEDGNLHHRNEQIRDYCRANDKWLFDFADIESYDPDGAYYLDRLANDACSYDSDGDGEHDANWAVAWQESHEEGVDWYECGSAHSQPVNANMKAYAAWWLFVEIAWELVR